MTESTRGARNVPEWLGWLQSRLPALTLAWVVVCVIAVLIKLCYWLPVAGLSGLLKGYSLSAAGDFLAGVAAVPALAWLVVAYYVQWRELEATSEAIREQTDLHRKQVRLAELERLQATDPRFSVKLTAVDGPLHIPVRDIISGRAPDSAKYRIIVQNFGNHVRDVTAEFVDAPESLAYANVTATAAELPPRGGFNLDLPWRTGFPCAMRLLLSYTRLDTSRGQQEFFINPDGQIRRLIADDE
jgi:hypothetical protein